jgi:SPP1 gp7 family putative phage head morphogenesis protein
MKTAEPLRFKQKYFKELEKEINRLFFQIIFKPIVKVLDAPLAELINAVGDDPLETAMRRGTVYFEDGRFHGAFNSGISKRLRSIGANFNPKSKTWTLGGHLPSQLSIAAADADMRYTAAKERLVSVLDGINTDAINDITEVPDLLVKSIDEMEADYKKTMQKIMIPPSLTQEQLGTLAAEYGMSLDKYIKDWTDDCILDLREKVQQNAFAGRRSSALIEEIQYQYNVSQRKARFLARQETSLLMSKFRETRYKSAGSNRYKWSGSMDQRERQDHKDLEGTVVYWDSPPVTDKKSGARNHAGEDYGCRCVAIPIFD